MSDAASAPAALPVASPKKAAAKKATTAKKPALKADHPPTAQMVNAAIRNLKDKKGSSLQAIKKYIAANYKVDVEKQSTFIRKYLKSAVEKKVLVQTKGSGAAGSFKLAEKSSKVEKVVKKKPATKKPASPKKPAAKKAVGEKAAKKAVSKKPASEKKTIAAKKPKSPKPKKAAGSPKKPKAVKPKVAKPKKTAVKKAKATKPAKE
ncbi:hypothetical protein TKK_0016844 [Trichogramma kaykai]|uniref:H15 domain-containing protein n=1 Tax=Trichogramma kaykai TaxID=54128 RepID=A0ABD2W4G7_9HYME